MATIRSWLLVGGVVLMIGSMVVIGSIPGISAPQIQENRVLAPRPAWATTFAGLAPFRKGVDAYIADNFPARAHLIGATNYGRYRLGYSGSSNVVVGRDGWLFFDDGSHLAQMRPSKLTTAEAQAWIAGLKARTSMLNTVGVTYLVLVPPVKERVYPELAPAWTVIDPNAADADLLAKVSSAEGSHNVLWLRAPLHAARAAGNPLYSPFDTHWTGYGAHVAYSELMHALARKGFADKPLPLDRFTRWQPQDAERPQDLALMLGISSFVIQDFPQLVETGAPGIASMRFLTDRQDAYGDRVIDTGRLGKPVILVTGDSFSSQLLPFLYPHFSRIVFSHIQQGSFRLDLVDKFSPRVVLLETLERQLPTAMAGAVVGTMRETARIDTQGATNAVPGRSGACALDSLVQGQNDGGQPTIHAAGWAADVEGGRIPAAVTLVLQSSSVTYSAGFPASVERNDVAKAFRKPALRHSGFDLIAGMGMVRPGSYDVYLLENFGAHSLFCATAKKLNVP